MGSDKDCGSEICTSPRAWKILDSTNQGWMSASSTDTTWSSSYMWTTEYSPTQESRKLTRQLWTSEKNWHWRPGQSGRLHCSQHVRATRQKYKDVPDSPGWPYRSRCKNCKHVPYTLQSRKVKCHLILQPDCAALWTSISVQLHCWQAQLSQGEYLRRNLLCRSPSYLTLQRPAPQ